MSLDDRNRIAMLAEAMADTGAWARHAVDGRDRLAAVLDRPATLTDGGLLIKLYRAIVLSRR